ncbi:MAG: two-component sensor histidine kinase [Chitinophagaceae bacterium]|nr:two-component sensor histidine kinase [Chitinophagaceae bacterium]
MERTVSVTEYVFQIRGETDFIPKANVLLDYLKSVNDQESQDFVQLSINDQLAKTGDYITSLTSCLDILSRFEKSKDTLGIMAAYRELSTSYYYAGDKEKDVFYGKKSLPYAKELNNVSALTGITNNISTSYSQNNMGDSALLYAKLSVDYSKQLNDPIRVAGSLGTLGEAYISLRKFDLALPFIRQSLIGGANFDDLGTVWNLNALSQIFLETNQLDSSNYYAHKAIDLSIAPGYKDQLQRAYEYLSQSYEKTKQPDSAFKYLQSAVKIKDALHSAEKAKQLQAITAREQSRVLEMEKANAELNSKIKIYSLIAVLIILAAIAFFLLRNNRQKQKANIILETTLSKLKETQAQLIQSEKMASLGELTAGIAHEIQNPLNFVNNFSEVNVELIEELASKKKAEPGDPLIQDILDNQKKIVHHGKRADAIVKGMLQHSQKSTGRKEPTDINALADEYLRLSYHGLRAKNNSFNATIKTDFDPSIASVSIVSQDIARVLLNLYTNAFYAVQQRQEGKPQEYQPTVSVATKRSGNNIEIRVRDNGHGIAPNNIEKIFQPFFTTKPTGQGTGLGLSLSYDIIKAHGGELTVESKEGEGSTFIVTLPVK